MKKDYKLEALLFAEKYGVIEYKVKKNKMIWNESYPGEHTTYKSFLDLDTMKETKTKLRKYYAKFQYNA